MGGWMVVCSPYQNHSAESAFHDFQKLTTSAPAFNTHGVPTFGAKPCARSQFKGWFQGALPHSPMFSRGYHMISCESFIHPLKTKLPSKGCEALWYGPYGHLDGLQTLLHLVLFHLTSWCVSTGRSGAAVQCPCNKWCLHLLKQRCGQHSLVRSLKLHDPSTMVMGTWEIRSMSIWKCALMYSNCAVTCCDHQLHNIILPCGNPFMLDSHTCMWYFACMFKCI